MKEKKIMEIAFYVAHWNYNGIGIPETAVLERISKHIQISRFKELLNEFRVIALESKESRLQRSSDSLKVHESHSNKTVTQIRAIVKNNLKEL